MIQRMPDWVGILPVVALGLFFLPGCASMGAKRGYKDAQRYDTTDCTFKTSPMGSYGYNYMRAWEYHKLENARAERNKQLLDGYFKK